jgi:hypothetical protein|uniref:Uncharacterized protein n=1 Tax=Zea mays TaxID=4577 RepID=A0A804QGX7_MAIZE
MRRSPRRREERARRIVPSFACAPGRAGADQLLQRLSLSLSSVTTVSGYLERTRDREREREAAGERTKDREREGGWGEETCCARRSCRRSGSRSEDHRARHQLGC